MGRSNNIFRLLRSYESPNVTFIEPDGSWPIVWKRASGVHVWDAEGRKYLDLTAAFGVAVAGHANARVVRAGQRQMGKLLHAMGDVHPHPLKAQLARELSHITFERWDSDAGGGKAIFCNAGFEAVEAALKTALLATGKPGVIVFSGSYHGLGYGALTVTHRQFFRGQFESQLARFGHFVPFPTEEKQLLITHKAIRDVFRKHLIGAVLIEPIQGRAGIRVSVTDLLPLLRKLCDENSAVLIADEVFTGFGRTGRWFACEHFETIPDIICLGKALTGGFPLSACVGRADLMDAAWPKSTGEALHTSTFLGHPVGCAMALANIREIEGKRLVNRSRKLGAELLVLLNKYLRPRKLKLECRGLGLMMGIELRRANGKPASQEVWRIVKAMLRKSFILLPEGEHGNVISFTPPLVITRQQLASTVRALAEVLNEL